MAENKVHFGLKNAYYAVLTETTDPQTGAITTTYGDWKKCPGAVSIGLSNNASQEDFYADDGQHQFRTASERTSSRMLRTPMEQLSKLRILRQLTLRSLMRHQVT